MIYADPNDAFRNIYGRRFKFPSMVSQVAHMFDILHWTYFGVLGKHNISFLQLAIFRRCLVNGNPYTKIITATGVPKVTVWRQCRKLANRGLIVFEAAAETTPPVQAVELTGAGYRLLLKIDAEVEEELLRVVCAKEYRSQRVKKFTKLLWRANGFLPRNGLAGLKSFRPSRLADHSKYPPSEQLMEEPEETDSPDDDGTLPY